MTHLRQRMIEDMGIRNLADNTQSASLQQIISYAGYFHRSPEELGPEAVRAYRLYLTNTRRLSPGSCTFLTHWKHCKVPMPLPGIWLRYERSTGWFTPSHRLAALSRFLSIWAAIRIGWLLPISV